VSDIQAATGELWFLNRRVAVEAAGWNVTVSATYKFVCEKCQATVWQCEPPTGVLCDGCKPADDCDAPHIVGGE
jgi:hypothetical protein